MPTYELLSTETCKPRRRRILVNPYSFGIPGPSFQVLPTIIHSSRSFFGHFLIPQQSIYIPINPFFETFLRLNGRGALLTVCYLISSSHLLFPLKCSRSTE